MKIPVLLLLSAFCLSSAGQTTDVAFAGLKTDEEKADTIYAMARKYFRSSRLDSAGYFISKGFVYAEKTGNSELIAKYIVERSNLLFFRNDFEEGLAMIRKAYPYLVKTASSDLYKRYYLLTGRLHENLHHNDSALYYYHQCELRNNSIDPYSNWIVYYNIAQMFKRSEAFSESEKYFSKAYNLTKPKAIRLDHITVLIEYADLYYLLGDAEKFTVLMSEQQKMMEQVKRDFSGNPVHNMYFKARRNDPLQKKLQFMKEVKIEIAKTGRIEKIAEANNYIASFYEDANQPDSALFYIQENIRLFEKKQDIFNLFNNTKTAFRLLKKAGYNHEAIAQADRLMALKDSLIILQQRETVLDLEAKYEAEKKEREIFLLHSKNLLHENEIALLNTLNRLNSIKLLRETDLKNGLIVENKLKDSIVKSQLANNILINSESELKSTQLANEQLLKDAANRENTLKGNELIREKKIRWQLSFGALMLLVSGVVIFLMYRRQRVKNRIIQKQSDDMQVLMKEIHHRVKNNLQIISSLLDLQALSIKDKHAAGAVREGKIRVQSMALIHQNLYSEGNIKGIVMKDYINKLVENLFQSYNIQADKIKLVTDIDHLNLDVDTVIPLGLIVNELISNSLKYAFKETVKGQVYVSLKEHNKLLHLQVNDNGCGFPANWNKLQNNSFGFNLIHAFAQKLKAKLDVYNDGGACVSMNIARYKMA